MMRQSPIECEASMNSAVTSSLQWSAVAVPQVCHTHGWSSPAHPYINYDRSASLRVSASLLSEGGW